VKLIPDLEARFVQYRVEPNGQTILPTVDALADAHGVMFVCPKCMDSLGTRVGAHSVICWFVGRVPDDAEPGPGRWNPAGTGLHDLSFVGPGACSVLLTSGCCWHGYVRNGEATLQ